ncbi:hypothetical protein [Clostridium sp. 1001271B_151109_B4]|uniref:hypothetical protein n=1 Tax=Clostridium sp. 1001271B_151109_B4 TaxID=2787148 RepID=UPI0018AB1BD2|nr:hypothetical protein [Clostridium sp. 1001271B_151109_B4]
MSAFSILFRNLNVLKSNLLVECFNNTGALISSIITSLLILITTRQVDNLVQYKKGLLQLFIMQVLINTSSIENVKNIDNLLSKMQKPWNDK